MLSWDLSSPEDQADDFLVDEHEPHVTTAIPERLRWRRLRVFLSTPSGLLGTAVVLVLVVVAIIGPTIWDVKANIINTSIIFAHPSSRHLLGTDALGRDLLSRLLVATRQSLIVGVLCAAVAVVLGVTVGAIIVVSGGRARPILLRLVDSGIAIPGLLLALLIAAIVGVGVKSVVLGIGIAGAFGFARITSTLAMSVASRDYMTAARTLGIRGWRLTLRYLLPNMAEPMIIFLGVAVGSSIVAAAGLSFLGVGTQPPSYDWGQMLTSGIQNLYQTPAAALAPAIAIGITALAFGLSAEGVARSLNPRLWTTKESRRDRRAAFRRVAKSNEVVSDLEGEAVVESSNGAAELEVRDLVVTYPGPSGPIDVVRGLSLTINKGDILGIVGESGSGKTMTALAIAQLAPFPGKVSGSIKLRGQELTTMSKKQLDKFLSSNLGLVYQDPLASFNPALTIGKQLTEAVRSLTGMKRRDANLAAIARLKETRVPTPEVQMHRYPHELSGGMRQRAMIAMALMNEPTLLVADEPTSALDVSIQAQIMTVIKNVNETRKTAVMMISHNLGLVSQVCNRVVIMYAGNVVEELSVEELLTGPRHPYTQGLINAIPDIDQLRDKPLQQIDGEPVDSASPPSGCPYHPRCPHAAPECSEARPVLIGQPDSDSHRVACHIVNKVTTDA
jgi:oligopeptide/dipeptide ABC transporter ATP-binding protein